MEFKRRSKHKITKSQAWIDWIGEDDSNRSNVAREVQPDYIQRDTNALSARGVTEKSKPSSSDEININISLPEIRLPKINANWGRIGKWLVVGGLALGLLIGVPFLMQVRSNDKKQQQAQLEESKPAYAPLKPSATNGSQVSGALYDGKKQLYKYNAVYKGIELTISQQPLPDQVRKDPNKLKEIVESSLSESEEAETTNGNAYIVTDTKTGTQRVVVAHRQLLIFIQAYGRLDLAEWVSYIQDLQ